MQKLKKLSLLTLSLLISIQVGEFALSSIYFSKVVIQDNMLSHMEYSDRLGFKTASNTLITHKDLNYKTDKFGFRNPQFSRDMNKKLILLIGDSHVWGWGKHDKDLISAHLQKTLAGDDYQVFNIADIGYSSLQTYLVSIPLIKELKPYAIFWLNGHNDTYNNSRPFEHGLSRPSLEYQNNDSCLINFPPKRPFYFSRYQNINNALGKKTNNILTITNLKIVSLFKDLYLDVFPSPKTKYNNFTICKGESTPNGDQVLIDLNLKISKIARSINSRFHSFLLPNKQLHSNNPQYNQYIENQLKADGVNTTNLSKMSTKGNIYATGLSDLRDDHYAINFHKYVADIIAQELHEHSLSKTRVRDIISL